MKKIEYEKMVELKETFVARCESFLTEERTGWEFSIPRFSHHTIHNDTIRIIWVTGNTGEDQEVGFVEVPLNEFFR